MLVFAAVVAVGFAYILLRGICVMTLHFYSAITRWLLAFWPLIQSLLCQYSSYIVNVQAIAHTGVVIGWLHNRNIAIAIVVPRCSAVQHTKGYDLPAFQFYDLVTIICLAAISVMYFISFLKPSRVAYYP